MTLLVNKAIIRFGTVQSQNQNTIQKNNPRRTILAMIIAIIHLRHLAYKRTNLQLLTTPSDCHSCRYHCVQRSNQTHPANRMTYNFWTMLEVINTNDRNASYIRLSKLYCNVTTIFITFVDDILEPIRVLRMYYVFIYHNLNLRNLLRNK